LNDIPKMNDVNAQISYEELLITPLKLFISQIGDPKLIKNAALKQQLNSNLLYEKHLKTNNNITTNNNSNNYSPNNSGHNSPNIPSNTTINGDNNATNNDDTKTDDIIPPQSILNFNNKTSFDGSKRVSMPLHNNADLKKINNNNNIAILHEQNGNNNDDYNAADDY